MTWAIFSDQHLQAISEIFLTGSERVVAIVGGAILDDTLRRTLSERLRDDKTTANKLLRVNGPLGNTGPKIDLLYMLGAFDNPMREALLGLTEIRNFFAHNLGATFSSKTKEIQRAIKKLTLHNNMTYYPHHVLDGDSDVDIETIQNNKDLFIVNLKLCLIALMRDRVSHHEWSNKPLTKKALRERRRGWKRLQTAKREPKKP